MLSLHTAPVLEPLDIEEVKRFLRIPDSYTADDVQIDELIAAAREMLEQETGRQVNTATWSLMLDAFPCDRRQVIVLPRPPLQSVVSVSYVDSAGADQVWNAADYTVQAPAGPFAKRGELFPKLDKTYPSDVACIPGAVTIQFIAGWATVPRVVKATMLQLVADLYAYREGTITGTIVSKNPALERNLNRLRLRVYA